jgi:hypothetical protein
LLIADFRLPIADRGMVLSITGLFLDDGCLKDFAINNQQSGNRQSKIKNDQTE